MTGLAWRNLVRERTRLIVTIGGVAFAVLLILLLQGLYTGINDQASRYLRSVEGDVWVGQSGTKGGFGHSVSVLPSDMEQQLESLSEVRTASPLLGRGMLVETSRGAEADVLLMGYDVDSGIGGPPRIVDGARSPGPGEIVIDKVFARKEGIKLGEDLQIAGQPARVAGLSEGGSSLMLYYAWVPLADAQRLAGSQGAVSYYATDAAAGVSPEQLARLIEEAVPGVAATTAEDFVAASTADIREGFLPILLILVLIALVIGSAVIGLTIYTSVLERRQEYGVLKALGFSNRRLLGIVWRQAALAGVLGLAAGVPLTLGVAAAIQALEPQFESVLRPMDVVLVTAAVAVMSAVASFLPLRRVTRLDPAEAFRV